MSEETIGGIIDFNDIGSWLGQFSRVLFSSPKPRLEDELTLMSGIGSVRRRLVSEEIYWRVDTSVFRCKHPVLSLRGSEILVVKWSHR